MPDASPPPLTLPRIVLLRCPACGREHTEVLDVANDPPVWIFECGNGECGSIYNVTLAFDVTLRRKPSKWFKPRLAN